MIFVESLTEESFDDILSYSEKRLQNLAHEQIWKGTGTELDPFIIENANILGHSIIITDTSMYISFINCNFDHAKFEGCKNVILDNCAVRKLVLSRCEKFRIDSSYISNLDFSRLNQIYFRNSIILDVTANFKINNIFFEDCQINDDFQDSVLRKIYKRHYSKIIGELFSYIIIFSAFVFYRIFYMYYIFNSSDTINLILVIGLFFSILTLIWYSLYSKYLIKKKHRKISILNNKNA